MSVETFYMALMSLHMEHHPKACISKCKRIRPLFFHIWDKGPNTYARDINFTDNCIC